MNADSLTKRVTNKASDATTTVVQQCADRLDNTHNAQLENMDNAFKENMIIMQNLHTSFQLERTVTNQSKKPEE